MTMLRPKFFLNRRGRRGFRRGTQRQSSSVSSAQNSASSAVNRIFGLLLGVALFSLPLTARAQDTDRIDAQITNTPSPTYIIRNARIVTVSGADIDNGILVIINGHIAAVGANISAPAGAQEIDARGLTIYPGMIDLGSNMGLIEVPTGAPGTID